MSTPISGLDLAALINSVDQVAIEQAGETKRAPLGDIFAALGGGEVIENENGIAVRFSNGIQVCFNISRTFISEGHETAAAGGFRSDWTSIAFPASFSDEPVVLPYSARTAEDDGLSWGVVRAISSSGFGLASFRLNSSSSTGYRLGYLAAGTWDNE